MLLLLAAHTIASRSPITGDWASARGATVGVRVLFIGNSLTYAHDLPAMFARLAPQGDGERMIVVAYTRPGATLADFAADQQLQTPFAAVPWDYIVVQENSGLPSGGSPADANGLATAVHAATDGLSSHAQLVLFMTWAHEHGDSQVVDDTYSAMQDRVAFSYEQAARLLGAELAPVGLAWRSTRITAPTVQLWEEDGVHPTVAGSYLAAGVIYDVIRAGAPRSEYTAGLPAPIAANLQRIAQITASTDP
jgi:hypothetical protein